MRDCFDLPLTNMSASTARAYDDFTRELLAYGPNIRALFAAADDAPDAPLINAHAAAVHLAFEGAEGWQAATPYLARIRATERQATEREQLFCAAVQAWTGRQYRKALALLDELTVRWPADLCALKWAQYHAFNLGDQEALLRLGQRAAIIHENTPYVHGMHAFALEQNHRIREAEDEGMRATEIALDDAWAHHAVAHVMETEGRPQDGARWLDHCAHTWDAKGIFIRIHNWWHAALFRLSLGRESEALEIFDNRLWGEWPEFPQEKIGAASMLWRLELRGMNVGDRWAPIAEQAEKRIGEHLFPFHDLHYLIALTRHGNDAAAAELLSSLEKKAAGSTGDDAFIWGEICLPTAQAIAAFTRDDHPMSAEILAPVLQNLHRIGGSHAQRHIFVETFEACKAPSKTAMN